MFMRPTVNMNGTARESLVDQRREVMDALRPAMDKLRETAPHGRDYVGSPAQYDMDRATYLARYETLLKLFHDLQEEALLIMNGQQL